MSWCCYIRGLVLEYLPTLRGAKKISKFATIYCNIYVLVLDYMSRVPRPHTAIHVSYTCVFIGHAARSALCSEGGGLLRAVFWAVCEQNRGGYRCPRFYASRRRRRRRSCGPIFEGGIRTGESNASVALLYIYMYVCMYVSMYVYSERSNTRKGTKRLSRLPPQSHNIS